MVKNEIINILDGQMITAYNTAFDFEKFLFSPPWGLDHYCKYAFDIADLATAYIGNELHYKNITSFSGIRWKVARQLLTNQSGRIHMIDAYRYLCPENPADLQGEQTHTALHDAIMEAHILRAILCRRD